MWKKFRIAGNSGSSIPPTVEEATEGTHGYPGEYRVAALRERRLLMALRGVCIALIMSILLIAVLAFIILSMMPLKEIRPFLVQVAEEGTVVAAIRPIQDTFDAKDLLTEKLVREYVVNRHEILRSNPVMQHRWSPSGYIGTMTAAAEYNRFRDSMLTAIEEIRSHDAQRLVTITAVNTVTAGSVYLVDFLSTAYDQHDTIIEKRNYTATLEIDFRALRDLTREQMLINPTGFTVVYYSLAEKER